ncbi:MAG: zeta toxin family protein [Limisphaerales bacterium]
MEVPELWIIAGPNGAGKTTFSGATEFRAKLDGVRFFNPDELTLALLRKQGYASFATAPQDVLRATNIRAAEEVFKVLTQSVVSGEHVGVETVLSTDKYKPLVERVRELRGRFYLIYVSLASPALSLERVRRRVSMGGHDVPAEKLGERWQRSLDNLTWFAREADDFWVFDNSDSNRTAPLLLAHGWREDSGKLRIELHHAEFGSPASARLLELGPDARITVV